MLGLVSEYGGITAMGNSFIELAQQREMIINDIAHFLHYTGWNGKEPEKNTPLLFYRIFCDYLYSRNSYNLKATRDELERTILEVGGLIEQNPEIAPLITESLSLSPDTIHAAVYWLEALDPPVIVNGHFQRRDFCHPELFLLALGYMMRDEPEALGVDILLSHERRQVVCQACLLDPDAFDTTLDWMLPLYPHIVSADADVGYYGRYIRLHHLPTLEDLPR
jgi:hypothetical protein